MEIFAGRRLLDPFGQGTRQGIEHFGRQGLAPIFLHDSVPADYIEKVVSEKREKTL